MGVVDKAVMILIDAPSTNFALAGLQFHVPCAMCYGLVANRRLIGESVEEQ